MQRSLNKITVGYKEFQKKYNSNKNSLMEQLSIEGQNPDVMIVSCCDSRVDPAMILQCKPGELFIVRNVANIIPPYENDEFHHGTSAALEFGICYLEVKHLIIWGHSQCGGISALLNKENISKQNDFIGNWINIIKNNEDFPDEQPNHVDCMAKESLNMSYNNCFSFPWIKERVENNKLSIHRWFFNIKEAKLYNFDAETNQYISL